MKTSVITSAEKIDWSAAALQLINQAAIEHEEVEEVFFNQPTVKKITLSFPDQHERFYIDGVTDKGKRVAMVIYIDKKKIHLTYIKIAKR